MSRGGLQSRKPCGPKDNRLKLRSGRCRNCRRLRIKCDGDRPCSGCQSRKVFCSEPEISAPEINVLLYVPSTEASAVFTSAPGIPRPPPMPKSSSAIEAFFAYTGDLASPITAPFTPSALLPYIRYPGPITHVVEAIGEMRLDLVRNGVLDQHKTAQASKQLKRCLDSLLSDDGIALSYSTLLFSMLLASFENMSDATGYGYLNMMAKLSTKTFPRSLDGDWATPYERRCLVLCHRILEAYRAAVLIDDTTLSGFQLYDCAEAIPAASGLQSQAEIDIARYEHFCNMLLAVARVSTRAMEWTKDARSLISASRKPKDSILARTCILQSPEHAMLLRTGAEIVTLGRRVLEMARAMERQFVPPSDPNEFSILLPAFYNTAWVYTSRMFIDPAWTAVDSDLPGAEQLPHLHDRALAILDSIEARLDVVDFETLLFCPMVYVSSLEINDSVLRDRVRAVYERIASKGMVVAKTYLSDINMVWSFVAGFNAVPGRS